MRFCWFRLMPYPDFPDDFKQKNNSVWVDVNPKLLDPVRAHEIYNEYMDELEFAAECGFDAICVNEHHANGYGLMPSPNLIAASLARRTTDAAICVLGSSLALQSADAHRRRVRDDRLHLGRTADRRRCCRGARPTRWCRPPMRNGSPTASAAPRRRGRSRAAATSWSSTGPTKPRPPCWRSCTDMLVSEIP